MNIVKADVCRKSFKEELEVGDGTSFEAIINDRVDIWWKHVNHAQLDCGRANDAGNLGNRLSFVIGDP